jgi:hypothetical protein
MLHNVLLKAAVDGQGIEAVCQDLSGPPASNTVRVQLNQVLNVKDLKQHEQWMNEALTVWLPPALYPRRLELALDMHDEPSYEKSSAFEGYVCRAQELHHQLYLWRRVDGVPGPVSAPPPRQKWSASVEMVGVCPD